MGSLHLHREQVLFHGVHHGAPPCFYSSPEWTNQTLTLRVFHEFRSHPGSPTRLEVDGYLAGLQQSAPSPLDATKSYTLLL